MRSVDWRSLALRFGRWLRDHWIIVSSVVVGFWVVYSWLDSDRRASELRAFEGRKPFLERQLIIHFEAAQLIGQLMSIEQASQEWKDAERRFEQLYHGGLRMVASDEVLSRAQQFRTSLATMKGQKLVSRLTLDAQARNLIDEMRSSVDSTWSRKAVWVDIKRFSFVPFIGTEGWTMRITPKEGGDGYSYKGVVPKKTDGGPPASPELPK